MPLVSSSELVIKLVKLASLSIVLGDGLSFQVYFVTFIFPTCSSALCVVCQTKRLYILTESFHMFCSPWHRILLNNNELASTWYMAATCMKPTNELLMQLVFKLICKRCLRTRKFWNVLCYACSLMSFAQSSTLDLISSAYQLRYLTLLRGFLLLSCTMLRISLCSSCNPLYLWMNWVTLIDVEADMWNHVPSCWFFLFVFCWYSFVIAF